MERFIRSESLVHTEPTLKGLRNSLISGKSNTSLFFGCGLTTPKAPSIGLPFDALIFVLIAEKLRRKLKLENIYCHIADTHALSNKFCDKERIIMMANHYKAIFQNIAKVSGIPLEVRMSSEFDTTIKYKEIFDSINTDKGEYMQRELTDILWYRETCNVHLKLGWLLQPKNNGNGFDERVFDKEFCNQCDDKMSFAYTVPGKTLDVKRSKVSPYVSISSESRILFDKHENVFVKLKKVALRRGGSKKITEINKHFSSIIRLWNDVSKVTIPNDKAVISQVQLIIDTICK